MTYSLGVDLGTTYTAAAIRRGDRLEIVDLGTRSAAIPSVVYLRDDGTVLTGDAALRRGATDPARLAREFKRRMGDTTAILLGGVPYSVDALMARLLEAVVRAVTERQGEPPASIVIAHPANWGQYKKDLLDQAVRRADLNGVGYITEPQAAAVHYASLERLEPGQVVAVYDLGGGTFDAAVVRATATGFELIGEPEGIERLGGIDFDEAVFRHVTSSIGGALGELDADDPVAQAAVSRLRDECVAAKEALSSDTEVSIPVILPNVHTDVRLTRTEFEAMIRPALADTLVVLNRAMRSAGVEADDLHSVLLVGGSSRIPLISQLVGAELGRPVALDVHPKHSVALGAATLAAGPAVSSGPAAPVDVAEAFSAPAVPLSPMVDLAPAAAASATLEPAMREPSIVEPPVPATMPAPAPAPLPTAPAPAPTAPLPTVPMPAGSTAPVHDAAASSLPSPPVGAGAPGRGPADPPSPPPFTPMPATAPDTPARSSRRRAILIGAGVGAAVVIGVIGVIAFGGGGGSDGDGGDGGDAAAASVVTDAPIETTGSTPTPSTVASTVEVTVAPTAASTTVAVTAAPTAAPTTVEKNVCSGRTAPCIVLTSVKVTDSGAVEVIWEPFNFVPDVDKGFHAHLYWNNLTAEQAGANGAEGQGQWDAHDETIHTSGLLVVASKPPNATSVCVTVGLAPDHNVPRPDIFHCLPLPDPGG